MTRYSPPAPNGAQPPGYPTTYKSSTPPTSYEDSQTDQDTLSELSKLAHEAVKKAETMASPDANYRYYGGDPPNAFHELRRFLLESGIDTRVFSFGSIPLPEALAPEVSVNANTVGTLDNSFFFEFRKIVQASAEGIRVNTLVLLVRVFFEHNQDSAQFHVQLVLNHHKDAIYELNDIYDSIIQLLRPDATWAEPSSGSPIGRITYFEKTYGHARYFKQFMSTMLLPALKKHGITGNNLIPTEPGF